jgi:hypothetical protein
LIEKISFLCRNVDQSKSKLNQTTGDDEEFSSEIHPVITDRTLTDSISLKTNSKICLGNGRANTIADSSDQTKPILYADPWIRRCDQPLSSNYHPDQDDRPKSIQYETRLYYQSLSSTSDEHLSHQQRQPLLNNIDKDIEYVESRLRGQTTVSLPASHSATYTRDGSWRQYPHQNFMHVLLSPNDPQQQQQTRLVHQKYPTTTNTQQINETNISTPKLNQQKSLTPSSVNTNGSVKTVKSRMEKIKDQKAAKTLR